MNLRMLLLKTEIFSDFLRWRSKLFHSITVDGKKEFLKKLCFVSTRGILCIFRVEYNERLVGIKLNRFLEFTFSKTLWKRQSFLHQRRSRRDSNPNSWHFSFDVPLIVIIKARHALCWIDSRFSLNELLKAWSYRISP